MDPSDLPTPIARSLVRYLRTPEEHIAERFNCLSYLFETALKSLVTLIHSMIQPVDHSTWLNTGYRLLQANGIGTWEEALSQLEESARIYHARGALRTVLDWLSDKSPKDKQTDLKEVQGNIIELISTNGVLASLQPNTKGLIKALVNLRNKTPRGHGAQTPDFQRRANHELWRALVLILAESPITQTELLYVYSGPGGPYARPLKGPIPTAAIAWIGDGTGLYIRTASGEVYAVSPLMRYESDSDRCYFVNGDWDRRNETTEMIDYLDGSRLREHIGDLTAGVHKLIRSETAGTRALTGNENALFNLPPLADGYVSRAQLELRLSSLLSDRQHRIITLHGMGGAGKTSLSLRVARSLVERRESPFDVLLWFSGRDIDLSLSGPQERAPDVLDLEGMAREYCRLLEIKVRNAQALERFAEDISSEKNRTLLVVDNFETFRDPELVQRYLDETVTLPNKVLITSRLRSFRGDYPVEVRGMELVEARQLLLGEARRLGCEPQMTSQAITSIHEYTMGVPYAMKLIASQIGRRLPLHQIIDRTVARDDILDVLFLRAFKALSDDSRRLFLMAGNLPPRISSIPIRTVLARREVDFAQALDECERWSLVEVVADQGWDSLHIPEVGRKFAARRLPAADQRLEIESDLGMIKETYVRRRSDRVPAEWARDLADLIQQEQDESKSAYLIELVNSLAHEFPESWRILAALRTVLGDDPESIREAYEMASEHAQSDSRFWQDWADFEESQGAYRREVELRLQAADCDPGNIGLNSNAAFRVGWFIANSRPPYDDKVLLVTPLIRNLEREFSHLDPSPLARLGWLYLVIADRSNAKRCAMRGLLIDSTHEHCQNLMTALDRRAAT